MYRENQFTVIQERSGQKLVTEMSDLALPPGLYPVSVTVLRESGTVETFDFAGMAEKEGDLLFILYRSPLGNTVKLFND